MTQAETTAAKIKVAFFRDGYLWMKVNNKEEKITKTRGTYYYPPQWSHDGKYVLYQKEIMLNQNQPDQTRSEIWVYDITTKKHTKIFYDGNNPKWSPMENIIAFQSDGGLNVSDLNDFYNVALGVDDYNWTPDGKGFIASSVASLHPDGWTNPILYKIKLEEKKYITDLTKNVKQFFVIPKVLSKGNSSIISINAGSFLFSPDQKWISFIVNPTASWSMDSDMVCVISTEGKNFEVIDEIIFQVDAPKWANHKNLLGYIAGGGRLVFGYTNKKMKITELPAYTSLNLTPPKFAELGFTWCDDDVIIVSRVPESAWFNDPQKRPKPSLYKIKINDLKQIKITTPPKGFGDYNPIYTVPLNKITWLRKKETDLIGDLWIADLDGKNAKILVKNIGNYSIYQK
jgi:hypothetical protein